MRREGTRVPAMSIYKTITAHEISHLRGLTLMSTIRRHGSYGVTSRGRLEEGGGGKPSACPHPLPQYGYTSCLD